MTENDKNANIVISDILNSEDFQKLVSEIKSHKENFSLEERTKKLINKVYDETSKFLDKAFKENNNLTNFIPEYEHFSSTGEEEVFSQIILVHCIKKYCDQHSIKFTLGSETNEHSLLILKENLNQNIEPEKFIKNFGANNRDILSYFCNNNIDNIAGDPRQRNFEVSEIDGKLISQYLRGYMGISELAKKLNSSAESPNPYLWNISRQGLEDRNVGMLEVANNFHKDPDQKSFYLMFVGTAHLDASFTTFNIEKPTSWTKKTETVQKKKEEFPNLNLKPNIYYSEPSQILEKQCRELYDDIYKSLKNEDNINEHKNKPDNNYRKLNFCTITKFYETLQKCIDEEKQAELNKSNEKDLEKSK